MATKDHYLRDKLSIGFDEVLSDQYSNLNLNHNYQSLHADNIQSKKVANNSRKNENYAQHEFKKSKNAKNSTLSLHIAAYENTIETDAAAIFNVDETEFFKNKNDKTTLIKKWENTKKVFADSSSLIQVTISKI
uniref:Uncharacterized protein n=1 Tax=Panagrolaimus sp. ES5 TaxID=591445 RepID=A0AC34F7Y0_9BILA